MKPAHVGGLPASQPQLAVVQLRKFRNWLYHKQTFLVEAQVMIMWHLLLLHNTLRRRLYHATCRKQNARDQEGVGQCGKP